MPFPEYIPTVPEMIARVSAAHRDADAIVLGDERLSFADAEVRSANLARGLIASGVCKGSHVGLLMPNGPDWLVAFWAITRIGAVLVPLNTFSRAQELAWFLRHADLQTVLCVDGFLGHDYLDRLEAAVPGLAESHAWELHLPSVPHLRRVFVHGERSRPWSERLSGVVALGAEHATIDRAFLAAVEATVGPADDAVILYSSGSTAEPKGAIHTHGTIVRHSFNVASARDARSDDRIWSPMPFFWVGGFCFSLMGNLHVGATTLCEHVFDPETTLRFLERERVTGVFGWPHFGTALEEHPTRRERDLSSLRTGNLPGLLPNTIVPSDAALRGNSLGMTETCGPHTWGGLLPLPEIHRGSFGPALEGVEHKIVDPETGARVSPGTSGEICIRGYSVMRGLYKVERETVFDEEGFYRSGDGGSIAEDGHLYFEGRLGDMIKTGGANVTPSEVETMLRAYEGVEAAYVVGVPDAGRGEIVEAAVVPDAGATLDPRALRARLKGELSAYKVPRHVFLFAAHEIPLKDSGKLDRRGLARLISTRADPSE